MENIRLRRLQDKKKPTEHISRTPRAYISWAHPSAHQVYIDDYEDYDDYKNYNDYKKKKSHTEHISRTLQRPIYRGPGLASRFNSLTLDYL